jgi:ABC-type transport system involved in multi-copper enzyme maturation permease subunit
MSWLVWRQYRLQAAIAAVLLAAFAAVMLTSGLQMASQWHSMLGSCTVTSTTSTCGSESLGSAIGHDFEVLSIMVPGILGIFWGAPLVAHEIESGTSTFAWTQTVTRIRWLTAKAGWLLLAAAVWGGAVAVLVTWWSGPRNALYGNAFEQNIFDVQGIVPVGYAVFATALGITAGTLLRRTLPAIAVTLGGFIGLRVLVDDAIRQHYMTAVTTYSGMQDNFSPPAGSWQLASGLISKTGQVLSKQFSSTNFGGVPLSTLPASCQKLSSAVGVPSDRMTTGLKGQFNACFQSAGFRQFVTYQPANRFWAFQGIETGIFVLLGAALLAVTYVVVRRRDA